MNRLLVTAAMGLALVAFPATASAHNAGHVWLPDGTCLNIGSFKDAPTLGNGEQLDLVPETPTVPFDEIGVSFVGHGGGTPIEPGGCR